MKNLLYIVFLLPSLLFGQASGPVTWDRTDITWDMTNITWDMTTYAASTGGGNTVVYNGLVVTDGGGLVVRSGAYTAPTPPDPPDPPVDAMVWDTIHFTDMEGYSAFGTLDLSEAETIMNNTEHRVNSGIGGGGTFQSDIVTIQPLSNGTTGTEATDMWRVTCPAGQYSTSYGMVFGLYLLGWWPDSSFNDGEPMMAAWDVMWPQGADFTTSGKLPGLTGWNGDVDFTVPAADSDSTTYEGISFTARSNFRGSGTGQHRLSQYDWHPERTGLLGDNEFFWETTDLTSTYGNNSTYYQVDVTDSIRIRMAVYVQPNSFTGSVSNDDGFVAWFINDTLVLNRTHWTCRTSDTVSFAEFTFQWFFGGGAEAAPSTTQRVHFDNVAILKPNRALTTKEYGPGIYYQNGDVEDTGYDNHYVYEFIPLLLIGFRRRRGWLCG